MKSATSAELEAELQQIEVDIEAAIVAGDEREHKRLRDRQDFVSRRIPYVKVEEAEAEIARMETEIEKERATREATVENREAARAKVKAIESDLKDAQEALRKLDHESNSARYRIESFGKKQREQDAVIKALRAEIAGGRGGPAPSPTPTPEACHQTLGQQQSPAEVIADIEAKLEKAKAEVDTSLERRTELRQNAREAKQLWENSAPPDKADARLALDAIARAVTLAEHDYDTKQGSVTALTDSLRRWKGAA